VEQQEMAGGVVVLEQWQLAVLAVLAAGGLYILGNILINIVIIHFFEKNRYPINPGGVVVVTGE